MNLHEKARKRGADNVQLSRERDHLRTTSEPVLVIKRTSGTSGGGTSNFDTQLTSAQTCPRCTQLANPSIEYIGSKIAPRSSLSTSQEQSADHAIIVDDSGEEDNQDHDGVDSLIESVPSSVHGVLGMRPLSPCECPSGPSFDSNPPVLVKVEATLGERRETDNIEIVNDPVDSLGVSPMPHFAASFESDDRISSQEEIGIAADDLTRPIPSCMTTNGTTFASAIVVDDSDEVDNQDHVAVDSLTESVLSSVHGVLGMRPLSSCECPSGPSFDSVLSGFEDTAVKPLLLENDEADGLMIVDDPVASPSTAVTLHFSASFASDDRISSQEEIVIAADDLTRPIPSSSHSGDGFFEHELRLESPTPRQTRDIPVLIIDSVVE